MWLFGIKDVKASLCLHLANICISWQDLIFFFYSEQRLDDIRYWKDELDDKLAGITTEIDNLQAFKTRVEKALESTREPLHIARQCLVNRYEKLLQMGI